MFNLEVVARKGKTWYRGKENLKGTVYPKVGEKVLIICPHSEVCMHMQVAGLLMLAELREQRYSDYTSYSVQLYSLDGQPYSSPITTGEAGFFDHEWNPETRTGTYYYHPPLLSEDDKNLLKNGYASTPFVL